MVRTRVGYAGGTKENPTYYSLGGHSETVQIDYDPQRISYSDLLEVFWRGHSPTSYPSSQQYKAIIFYHDEEQKREAIESRDKLEAEIGRKIITEIRPASVFYLAEDYHQKYYMQRYPELVKEFRAIYPDINDFVNSTAVARVNGYAGGYGTQEALDEELENLGLSPEGIDRVIKITKSGLTSVCQVPSR